VSSPVDAAKLPVMLSSLRLPSISRLWQQIAEQADNEGWGSARFLATLCEHEIADRHQRRIARHLAQSGLPRGKSLATFEFAAVKSLNKAKVLALAAADGWLDQGANVLIFGPSGAGKSHLAAAIGANLVDTGKRVLFTRGTDLVQKLQAARRDLGYVRKDQAETNVLFELIAERYERRSMIVTANQPFSQWHNIFPDEAMTVAAIDRLVHHATIFELNTESYRRRNAIEKIATSTGHPN
jgi:DNA replication protein DnaC